MAKQHGQCRLVHVHVGRQFEYEGGLGGVVNTHSVRVHVRVHMYMYMYMYMYMLVSVPRFQPGGKIGN